MIRRICRRILQILFFGLLPLSGEVLRDTAGRPIRYAGRFHNGRVILQDNRPKPDEFRGVWVAVVENIDFPIHRSQAEFQRDFCRMADNIKAAGFTAIIFQIRSNCDAFYPTGLAPWSRWLTGREGTGLGAFDPLKFMISETHKRNLEFHAWLNPYRVTGNTKLSKSAYLATLAPNNFARKNPQYVLVKRNPAGNQLFLDPGRPEVIAHLCTIVRDIVSRYQVDAIHFDDYFYPYEKLGNEDQQTFRSCNPGKLSLEEWRRSNTDALIYRVKLTITRNNIIQKRHTRFGISPFGIWANRATSSSGSLTGGKESFTTLFADTRKWVRLGYVDYIAPQIYWNFAHDVAAYAALTDWWCSVVNGTKVKLYIGIAAYNGEKWQPDELINQLRFNRMRHHVSGAAFFSYRSFFGGTRNAGAVNLLNYLKNHR